MKNHYFNILLFALPLNILVSLCHVYNERNHKSTTLHSPNENTIRTHRSLCECELFVLQNYDDPEMKEVIENYNRQASERFKEYDERMNKNRKECKEQCDKEIQKIILKEKIEKELTEKFATLDTNITTNDIPTCVCEKSLADKVEKGCLECGGILGAAMPELGSIGGSLLSALYTWKPKALEAAIAAAKELAITEATNAGVSTVVSKLKAIYIEWGKGALDLSPIVNKTNYKCAKSLVETAEELFGEACKVPGKDSTTSFCNSYIYYNGEKTFNPIAQAGSAAYDAVLPTKTAAFKAKNIAAVEATTTSWETVITASIIAIVVIVLILVIIYLILRYRRKKKMKKKLQYIKLLEE